MPLLKGGEPLGVALGSKSCGGAAHGQVMIDGYPPHHHRCHKGYLKVDLQLSVLPALRPDVTDLEHTPEAVTSS